MVARIAPSPITTAVASSDALAHAIDSSSALTAGSRFSSTSSLVVQRDVAQADPAPLSPPPGEAFAAAIIAGQLPPRPMTPEQLRQRLGSAWQPPDSSLRLMDRSA